MKKLSFVVLAILFFVKSGLSAQVSIAQQKKQIEQMKKNLLKLYFCTLVTEKFLSYKNLNIENSIKLKIFEDTLAKSLEYLNEKEKQLSQKIKTLQKTKELEKVRREIIEEIRRKLKKEGITDPLSRAKKIPKSYSLRVNSPTNVYAPFGGRISEVGIRAGSVFIRLKGKRCEAIISGIDELEVGMGRPIKEGQVIGRIFRVPKKFEFLVNCKKLKVPK
ncbi:MAG: M23 family metallopeptidase [Thermodesulfobacteria bacterium]|nr:M23 family metallopeptidase [Thermodesulfobacteriota bacterium]